MPPNEPEVTSTVVRSEPQTIVRVYERVLDMILLEEFCVSKAFRTWWLKQMQLSWASKHTFVMAQRSVIDQGRESDLVLLVVQPNGERHAVMIEDKIAANAQPEQGLSYRKRGIEGKKRGDWHGFTTCIVAPNRYLAAGPDVPNYDRSVSIESIRDWLSTSDMDPMRRDFKVDILNPMIHPPPRGTSVQQVWNKDKFLVALRENVNEDAATVAEKLIRWAEDVGLTTNRGTATQHPMVGFEHSNGFRLFTIREDGKVQVHFPLIQGFADDVAVRKTLYDALNKIPGINFPPTVLEKAAYQNFPITVLITPQSMQDFLDAMERAVRG